MITVVMVMDIHQYSVFGSAGLQLVFFLLVGGVLWFIPVALCSAEMATTKGWQEGGILTWVEETLGRRFGFAALFFQWFQATVAFITMLYFVFSALIAFFGMEQWENSSLIKFLVIMVVFWGLTFMQLGGIKNTSMIDKVTFIGGVILPAIIIAGLVAFYLLSGNQPQIDFTPEALIPDLTKPSALVVFVAFLLSYAGIEASASYVDDLESPQRDYPKAVILVVIAAVVLNTVGGLSIATVVPASDLSFSGGMIQALETLFSSVGDGLGWAVGIVALLMAIGVMGQISSWIVGPIKSMHLAAEQELLPKICKKTNKNDVPIVLIIAQGVVVTAWAAILTFIGGGENLAFIASISLTVVIYVLAYILLFIAYFVLIYKKKLKSEYQIRGGKVVKTLVAGSGLLVSVFSLVISFIPPSSVDESQSTLYLVILGTGFVVVAVLPFLIHHLMKKRSRS